METFVIVFWLACAVLSAVIAYRKKRKVETWFFLGLFFGVFALVAIILLRSQPDLTWRCPICGAMNQEMAFFCYSCNTKRTDIPL
jgi:hypothetical protein